MKNILHQFLCLSLVFCFHVGRAQTQHIVKGTVSDSKGPLPGVTVMVKGTSRGTVTDVNGKYSVRADENATLVFSMLGYRTLERAVTANILNVTLSEESGMLNEVVVLGYGTKQKATTVTGAVSTVSGKDLVATPVSNVTNMLIGNTPGLSGLQTSGEPGRNGASIYIRGVSTFTGNKDPLVVIDGIQQPSERPYDQLNAMDANEIENISVLKDASATAVYGIRGANGVIIVTTKRGKTGKPSLGFSTNYGMTRATNLMHNVSSYEYGLMRNEAIRTEQSTFGLSSFNSNLFTDDDLWKMQNNRDYTPAEVAAMTQLSDAQKTALNNSPALYYGSRDLFAEQFGGTGNQAQLNLNVSGGTEKVKYFASLGYFKQGSILQNTSYYGANTASTFDRYNFRTNFDFNLVKNLQVSVNIAGQFGTTSGPGYSNGGANPYDLSARYKVIMQYIFDSNPMTAPGLIDGKLVNDYAGLPGSDIALFKTKLGSLKGPQNAIYNLLTSGTENLYNTLLSNTISLKYDLSALTPGLSLRGSANYDDNYVKSVAYQLALPSYTVRRDISNPNNLDFFGGAVGANTFNAYPGHNSTWRKMYYDAGINYDHLFGEHHVTGLLLGTAQKYSIPGDSYNTPSGVMGVVGRTTYDYKERYLAEFSMGYNGSEMFAEGKRFGFFPAYSAGWVISNESFFPRNDFLTYLKLRGSYGEVGNDQLRRNGVTQRYLYLPGTFNTGQAGYYWGSSNGSVTNPYYSGSAEATLGNPDVTWERARKKDFGLELRLLKDRLSFTGDYFQEDRDNILTDLSSIIPYTYGVDAANVPPANVGKTTNHGYELQLGWNDSGPDFRYYVTANLNYAKNKIIYQAEATKPYPWMMSTGYSIGQKFGLVTDGFYNTPQELANRPYNTYNANKAALGDVRYVDINGDGLIDSKDVVPVGYPNLPQYTYSLKFGFSYKGFDLSTLWIGTANGSFSLNNYQFNTPFYQTAGNVMQYLYDGRWTADKVANGETIQYPRATMNGGAGGSSNFMASDLWTISSNFKRLKNVELGYTLPQFRLLKKANISAIRVYLNGNNLFTWDSKAYDLGLDPEATDGGGYSVYPMTKVFTFGANVTF